MSNIDITIIAGAVLVVVSAILAYKVYKQENAQKLQVG